MIDFIFYSEKYREVVEELGKMLSPKFPDLVKLNKFTAQHVRCPMQILMAMDDDVVIGFVLSFYVRAEINDTYRSSSKCVIASFIKPEYRGKGYGELMLMDDIRLGKCIVLSNPMATAEEQKRMRKFYEDKYLWRTNVTMTDPDKNVYELFARGRFVQEELDAFGRTIQEIWDRFVKCC